MPDTQTLTLLRDIGMGFAALIFFAVGFFYLLRFLMRDRDGWRETLRHTNQLANKALSNEDALTAALDRNTTVLQTALTQNTEVIHESTKVIERSTELMSVWSADVRTTLERIEAYATSNHLILQQIATAIGENDATTHRDDISRG